MTLVYSYYVIRCVSKRGAHFLYWNGPVCLTPSWSSSRRNAYRPSSRARAEAELPFAQKFMRIWAKDHPPKIVKVNVYED